MFKKNVDIVRTNCYTIDTSDSRRDGAKGEIKMTHTHTTEQTRSILGNELYQCMCGARKWSNGRAIVDGVSDGNGWYVPEEPIESQDEKARRHAIEMLQTEGYGYDYNQPEAHDPLDSHDPRNQD